MCKLYALYHGESNHHAIKYTNIPGIEQRNSYHYKYSVCVIYDKKIIPINNIRRNTIICILKH